MGIRIRKIIGYGAIFPGWREAFELLDKNSVNGEVNNLMVDNIPNATKYDHQFMETEQFVNKNLKQSYPKLFSDCIHYAEYTDDEGGYVVIMPPIWSTTWIRYDDVIDHYDYIGQDMETIVRILDRPIYPFNDWMDPETGERISDVRNGTILAKEYLPKVVPDIVPIVPFSVRLLADQIGMNWKDLRPMSITWWD